MSFEKLLDNLIEVLRERVRNGEITERRLARITGISQPHLHNVLKGVRVLTPDLSDRILREISLSVSDLWSSPAAPGDADVPIVQDPVGPGCPYPRECYNGSYPLSSELRTGLTHPAVFRLVRDTQMEPEVKEKDVVLVDRSQSMRHSPECRALYLVEFEGCGLIRYVRPSGSGLSLVTSETWNWPELWPHADLAGRDILEVIRGRIVWIGR